MGRRLTGNPYDPPTSRRNLTGRSILSRVFQNMIEKELNIRIYGNVQRKYAQDLFKKINQCHPVQIARGKVIIIFLRRRNRSELPLGSAFSCMSRSFRVAPGNFPFEYRNITISALVMTFPGSSASRKNEIRKFTSCDRLRRMDSEDMTSMSFSVRKPAISLASRFLRQRMAISFRLKPVGFQLPDDRENTG